MDLAPYMIGYDKVLRKKNELFAKRRCHLLTFYDYI